MGMEEPFDSNNVFSFLVGSSGLRQGMWITLNPDGQSVVLTCDSPDLFSVSRTDSRLIFFRLVSPYRGFGTSEERDLTVGLITEDVLWQKRRKRLPKRR